MKSGSCPGNIYAPLWQMGPGPGDLLPGVRDFARIYTVQFSVTDTSPQQLANKITLDGSGQFIWFGIEWSFRTGGAFVTADPMFQIRYPDGKSLCDDWLYFADVCGPLWPPQPMKPGGVVVVDIQANNFSGVGTFAGELALVGLRREGKG